MKTIDHNYINGKFVVPYGSDKMDIINPSDRKIIGTVRLGNEKDVDAAVSAAKEAFKSFSGTSVKERTEILQRIQNKMKERRDELIEAMITEYGAPQTVAEQLTDIALQDLSSTIETVNAYEFVKKAGKAIVRYEPVGVAAAITPWNADYINVIGKIAPAIAAGCTIVIKPSELSAIQTQLMAECIDSADVPPGVINIINGTGDVVGNALSLHPDIAKIAFTGSTKVGKVIRKNAIETMKRVSLELGGKSPNIIFDDADFTKAVPLALAVCYINSGQACLAGSRLLVPEHRLDEVKELVKKSIVLFRTGDPGRNDVMIGPMVTEKQYDRVQYYINKGIEEGAEVIAGGPGHPEGLENGNFVKPTVFAGVTPDMTIAKEEIFGPVLSILTYKTEEEALVIANDTIYGLQAYISTSDLEKANRFAARLQAGTVMINGMHSEPKAPFGGFKQSGIGREFGVLGLEEYLEPKTVLGHDTKEINLF